MQRGLIKKRILAVSAAALGLVFALSAGLQVWAGSAEQPAIVDVETGEDDDVPYVQDVLRVIAKANDEDDDAGTLSADDAEDDGDDDDGATAADQDTQDDTDSGDETAEDSADDQDDDTDDTADDEDDDDTEDGDDTGDEEDEDEEDEDD